jgi:hypothetical protein
MKPPAGSPQKNRAYILLELVIALTVFSIAVVGLSGALSNCMETANIINKDYAVRLAMRSFIEEVRRKPVSDMAVSTVDARLSVTFTSTVEPITLNFPVKNIDLTDLYALTVKAEYLAGGRQQEETLVVYVFQSQAELERRQAR